METNVFNISFDSNDSLEFPTIIPNIETKCDFSDTTDDDILNISFHSDESIEIVNVGTAVNHSYQCQGNNQISHI